LKSTWRNIAVVFGCLIGLALLFVSWVNSTREAGRRQQCANNLKQLGTALLNYDTVHRHFPPLYTTDKTGTPLHSWRTFLLPYLERANEFYQLRLDEPWDSLNNKPLTRIDVYGLFRCPSDTKAGQYHTNYVAVVGPGTAWQGGKGLTTDDIKDDPHDTILLIELKDSGIRWAEPRDLDLSNLPPGITKDNLLKSLSNHKGGFHALFADGHVELIPVTIPWADFEAMLTIAGGETVDRSKWEFSYQEGLN
jgi:prepilin-type processing-associated H-X9-DG protein